VRGTYRHGLDFHYSREINGRGLLRRPFPETEREGEEIGEKMVLTCGVHTSARGEGVRVPVRGGGLLGPRAGF
jgi:hypothetical protein